MRRSRAFILLAVLAVVAAGLVRPAVVRADIHVVGALSVEPAPEWGRKATDLSIARDWWFGRSVMAFTTQDWRYVFDKTRGRILVINLKDRYFVEAAMTAGVEDIVDPSYLRTLGRAQVNGTVAKSPQKMTVLGVECQGTVVSEWIVSDGQHIFDRDRTIYACPGVGFDWRMARDLTTWMISFFNPPMAYFGGLRSIEGFPLAETDIMTRNNQRVTYRTMITAMWEAAPPQDIYEIPAGFERREKLSQRDIQAMRQIQYLAYSF